MTNFFNRVVFFFKRVLWLSKLIGSYVKTINYLIVARKDMNAVMNGSYQGAAINFRGYDLSALKEVLIDQEYEFLNELVKDKKDLCVLDIGAHIGTFAIWTLGVNEHASIVSLEADPSTFKILESNAANQGVNWRVVNKAAWSNSDEELSFSVTGDSMGHKVSKEGEVRVGSINLSDVIELSGKDKIDIMKVDIEGSEFEFLNDETENLKKIDNLIIELHPLLCDTNALLENLRLSYGNITNLQNRISSKPLLFCRK